MTTAGDSFRSVMSQWPSGAVIVTTGAAEGGWHGMTASSFSSVSIDPPLVLVCLDRGTRTHRLIEERGSFAVSILGKDQAALGRQFAGPGERFTTGTWEVRETGAPVLVTSIGWLDCRIAHAYPGGDHTIFVGRVVAADTPRRVAPALFHSRTWGQLADPLPDEVAVADTGLLAALGSRGQSGVRLARALRAAGVRVRYDDPPPREDLDPQTASMLITDASQLKAAARAGVGVAETAGDRRLMDAARRAGMTVVARIPDAFHVDRLPELECDEIALEEGSRAASPLRVREVLQDATKAAGQARLRVRLRERHGIGMVNALIAMKSGVRLFDTTLGGVDGALPTEGVLYLAGQLEVASPADQSAVAACAAELKTCWDEGKRRE